MSTAMQLPPSENEGYSLLPQHFPGNELLGPYADLIRAMDDEASDYSDDELRAIYWTIALENSFDHNRFAESLPGFQMATYGFANPVYEESGR